MKGTKPSYPTLLELIRGKVKRGTIAGGSAVIIASLGGCFGGSTDGVPHFDYLGPLDVGGEDATANDLPLDVETLILGGKDIHYHLDLDHSQSEDGDE